MPDSRNVDGAPQEGRATVEAAPAGGARAGGSQAGGAQAGGAQAGGAQAGGAVATKAATAGRSSQGAPQAVVATTVTVAGATDAGKVRALNQDTYFVGEVPGRGYLAVVADGMGGHTAGEVASRRAVETMVEALGRSRTHAPVALAQAAQAANVEVFNYALEHPRNKGMGTTLTAVLLDDQVGLVGHVGDSRAYLVRGGELTRLTADHSWVADRVRQGLLSEEEARQHRWRNVITNAIGGAETFRLDVLYFDAEPGDVIVLVSDGVSMLMEEQQLLQLVKGEEPKTAVDNLVHEANLRGSPDNVTAVVMRIDTLASRPKPYDLPGTPLVASSVDISETLSGIKAVEEGFPGNGPLQRMRRKTWYPYRFWILGVLYLTLMLVLFVVWRT